MGLRYLQDFFMVSFPYTDLFLKFPLHHLQTLFISYLLPPFFHMLICIGCVYMYGHKWMHLCGGMHMQVCGGQRLTLDIFLDCSVFYILSQSILLKIECIHSFKPSSAVFFSHPFLSAFQMLLQGNLHI